MQTDGTAHALLHARSLGLRQSVAERSSPENVRRNRSFFGAGTLDIDRIVIFFIYAIAEY